MFGELVISVSVPSLTLPFCHPSAGTIFYPWKGSRSLYTACPPPPSCLCLIALQMAVVCACLLGASIAPEITNRLQPRVFKVLLGSHPKLPPLPTSFLPSEFQVFKFQLAMAGPLCPLPLSVPIYSSNSSLINDILWRPCLRTCSLASCFAPSDTNHDYTLIFN